MSLLDEFDALVSELMAEEDAPSPLLGSPCSFCEKLAELFLTHDQSRIIPGHDHPCLIPTCRSCGLHLMEVVEMVRGENRDSYFAQMMHALCGEDFVCRFCEQVIDMDTAMLAEYVTS